MAMARIALPIENGQLCGHFGHAPQFAIVEIEGGSVVSSSIETPPPHEPGSLPAWLSKMGVSHVICGGIGARAVELLKSAGIDVIAGVNIPDPAKAVEAFMAGTLSGAAGPTCGGHGHGEGHQCGHHH
jgi:predicted Fe-Mo cluster-binding NifX family protein